ncbi:flavin prenyltransferase UbiX [Campylobacterota bacterium]|nr:flavin prenyltransferase UbiX [Campylobacterota bacterium]
MKILFAICGASAAGLGLKAFDRLGDEHEKYIVLSESAKTVLEVEENYIFDNSDISAPSASGSSKFEAMIIAPCSMNTLAKISCGIADNLITRSAAVMIKERRKLLIAPRELPFDAIALENMLKLCRLGVIIAPPVIAYYSDRKDIDDLENQIIGKWFDLLNIENSLYTRWKT